MHVDYYKITKNFLLEENKEAGLMEYLSVISEMIDHFRPQRESDKARLMVMRENLRKAKKHARLLQERLNILEEEAKVVKEVKEDEE